MSQLTNATNEPKVEPNVSKDGATIRVKRSYVKAVTADLVKREIKLTMVITLDESSFAVRGDMALWAFEETPVVMTLRPVRAQLSLPMDDDLRGTLDAIESVKAMNGDQFQHAVEIMDGADENS